MATTPWDEKVTKRRQVYSLDSLVDQLLCEALSGDISSNHDRLSSVLLDLVSDELSLLAIEVGNDNFRTFLSEEEGRLSSDTLRGLLERR